MKRTFRRILVCFALVVMTSKLSAYEFSISQSPISPIIVSQASGTDNDYSKILKKQQKAEKKAEKKQKKKEEKNIRYKPFNQSIYHGRMTDFRFEYGNYLAYDITNKEIIGANLQAGNIQFDIGILPYFFIYLDAYKFPGTLSSYYTGWDCDAWTYGGGIGANKRLMFGRFPDNIYCLAGVNYYEYDIDQYKYDAAVDGVVTILVHGSIGYDIQLSKNFALSISDSFDFVPKWPVEYPWLQTYEHGYLSTLNIGLVITFPY